MEEKILEYLLKHPGAKAKDMAGFIIGNRQDTRSINQCLFYQLNGLVERYSSGGGWYITTKGRERLSTISTATPMSRPIPEDYELTLIKLRLLENPDEYNKLLKKVTEKAEQRDKENKRRLYGAVTVFFLVILALVACVIEKDNWLYCFLCLLAVGFILLPLLIFLLANKLFDVVVVKGIDYFTTYEEDGWTWVRLTDNDRNNYLRYILACDEYSHTIFIIDWNDISFLDGSIVIALKNRSQTIRYTCKSKSCFSTYKSELQSQFGQVKVEARDGQYCLYNPQIIEESILIIIRHLELVERERVARIDAIVNANPELLSASKNQTTIIITIKAQRSDYLNHLLYNQVSGISIIQTTECCSYATSTTDTYDKAFVFVIKNRHGKYCVVYENVNDDNASIVATVEDEEKCYECMATMVNYMRSHSVNKRETIRDTREISDFTVKSVNHNDIAQWKSNITGDSFGRKTTRWRYRRWIRW